MKRNFEISLCFSDSEYRNVLSEGVLRLQESGKLAALKIKWWKEKKGGGACSVNFVFSEHSFSHREYRFESFN